MRSTACLLLALAFAIACEDAPEGDATGPAGPSDTQSNVVFTIVSGTTSPASAATLLAGEPGNMPRDAIDGLTLTLTGLQVLQDGEGPWIDVPLAEGQTLTLDMLDVPESEHLILAEALLDPDHTYTDVRLLLSGTSLELNEEVCLAEGGPPGELGAQLCVGPGTVEEIFFPSGEQTGVKTDAEFDVTAEGQTDVTLVFDPDATVGSISWVPGREQILISPVIRAAEADQS